MNHTTTSAAEYLAAQGYTVKRRRVGGNGPPTADTIKHWCRSGKLAAERIGGKRGIWLISHEVLDELIKEMPTCEI